MPSSPDLVTFIDNTETRIVVEFDAEYAEKKFMDPIYRVDQTESIGHIWTERVVQHMGLDVSWYITKEEYTGETYILTFEKMWM
jgi:hypothetical protein